MKKNPDMRATNITVTLVATVGDHVTVKNPRSKLGTWEPGVVQRAEAGFQRDGSYGTSYDVILDRELPEFMGPYHARRFKRLLRVSVGSSDIKLAEGKA